MEADMAFQSVALSIASIHLPFWCTRSSCLFGTNSARLFSSIAQAPDAFKLTVNSFFLYDEIYCLCFKLRISMPPKYEEDWSDSDDEDMGSDVETSVQLGIPDGPIESSSDILDAAVSRIGGQPAFLTSPEPPYESALCKNCSSPMQLLVQVWCPLEDKPNDRALYVWGCARAVCQRLDGSVRAWRGLRYNERYAVKLNKKQERELAKAAAKAKAAEQELQQKASAKANPFKLNAAGAPNAFGFGEQIFGSLSTPAISEDKDEVTAEAASDRSADSESDSEDEALITAMASTTLETSEWKNAPTYNSLYMSTVTEYLPPAPKTKLPPEARADAADDGAESKSNTWAFEGYENSLDVDHVFERFTKRVGYEGEQCIRYELGGVPLPFAGDKVFDRLFPAPPPPNLPVTKPDSMVVPVQRRTYDPASIPPCPHCKGKRVFECQLMPNLINVLKPPGSVKKSTLTDAERRKEVEQVLKGGGDVDRMGMEWGTCMVFSCEKDCYDEAARSCWREEAVLTVFRMLAATPTISVPSDSAGRSDTLAISTPHELSAPPRFPHTRAQLTAIARQYRPLDNYDDDNDDDSSRITSAFVTRVAALLDSEHEEELKVLLKDTFGPSIEDEELSQHVLDLMHRHRDDVEGVPFLFLTPSRRPISRPSSRASTHSARLMGRPDTPNSAPSSPLAMVFRRPHTPLMSPLAAAQQGTSYMNPHGESPVPSPTIPHAQFTTSLPASPLSSPRILNAKAHEFKPIPRPLSAASSNPGSLATLRADTPSPDMWAHTSRPTSKLAIAAPLTPESALLPRASTPSSLRLSLQPGDDDEEDDPFDPFAPKPMPRSFHPVEPEVSQPWSNSSLSSSSLSTDDAQYGYYMNGEYDPSYSSQSLQEAEQYDSDVNPMLTDGMAPLDVLSTIFGSALAPSELEEALANNAYDFDRAMSWLVDRQIATQHATAVPPSAALKVQPVGNRVSIVSRDGFPRGGRGGFANRGQKFPSRPVPGGNRVCRYFLAGECLRADCRFSHDLERALCRFWLRGMCAKGESCEFLHHLPKDVDVSALTQAMARNNINNNAPSTEPDQSGPPDEFPALNQTAIQAKNRRGGFGRGRMDGVIHDPGRTRFPRIQSMRARAVQKS
ncbi:hypothetical protein NM688_g2531 [Phlebia brevispora]|uniref:Uncharacterized protein n=1 Tax=Phlebia brevispora TaxID=194682 RepID=A0ACC1T822_9APHY|nr:hypothetical protein NM688_g2531 [Phlebia brevispora]